MSNAVDLYSTGALKTHFFARATTAAICCHAGLQVQPVPFAEMLAFNRCHLLDCRATISSICYDAGLQQVSSPVQRAGSFAEMLVYNQYHLLEYRATISAICCNVVLQLVPFAGPQKTSFFAWATTGAISCNAGLQPLPFAGP